MAENNVLDDANNIKKVDKQSPKYILVLKLINGILGNLGKPQIEDLTEFIKIYREDVMKLENEQLFETMEHEFYGKNMFDKEKCGYYRKKNAESCLLNFLRGACKNLHLNLTYEKKKIQLNRLNQSYIIYSIK